MTKGVSFIAAAVIFCLTVVASAADYRYVKQETFRTWLETARPMIIVDIRLAPDYAKRHFRGAVETDAFPAKTAEEKKRLDGVLPRIRSTRDDVVIVCPRGGGGAKNTYDYLKQQGVDEKRMYILEKGSEGWPWPEMYVSGAGR